MAVLRAVDARARDGRAHEALQHDDRARVDAAHFAACGHICREVEEGGELGDREEPNSLQPIVLSDLPSELEPVQAFAADFTKAREDYRELVQRFVDTEKSASSLKTAGAGL